ncbi:hypothetical protein DVH05_016325 [Phytophthora capsici]|nr:hypothetical protein DVH05_016325 [Phytophthora capsici]
MCCGFRFLEFTVILLSSWAAGIVTNTIFEIGSLETSGGTVESDNSEATDTDYQTYFAGYTFAVALFFTIAMKIAMQCWTSKNLIKRIGRQEYMLRVGMVLKLTIMILAPVAFSGMEKMELKTNNELVTGMVVSSSVPTSTILKNR